MVTFSISEIDTSDLVRLSIELWSKLEKEQVRIGVAKAELHVHLPGFLLNEWMPMLGAPAFGDVT